jgi:chitinase
VTNNQSFAYSGWCSWFFSARANATACHPTGVAASLNGYVAAGVPRRKLGIGIGLYGSTYRPPITGMRQSSPVKNASFGDHVDTWAKFYKGGAGYPGFNMLTTGTKVSSGGGTVTVRYVWDTTARTGYYVFSPAMNYRGSTSQALQKVSVLTLEDLRSIAEKGAWVRAGNAGGTIVWAINYGHVSATVGNPPMKAIRNAFIIGH